MNTNLINEEINRVKLLMGYNPIKTLTENTEVILNEQWKAALEDLGKVVGRDSEGVLRSLENAFKDGTIDMRNMVTQDGVRLTKTADVLEAVRLGTLGPAGTGSFSKALFLKGSSTEMRVAGAEAITSMGKFVEKYSGKSREQIVELLMKDAKYSKADAEVLADTYLKKGRGKPPVPDPVPPVPDPIPPVPWNPKWNWRKTIKYLIGAGLIYWLWKWLTESSPFPECLRNKISEQDAQKIKDLGIEDALIIMKTGNSDIDSAGGGMFYENKEFKSVDESLKGEWSGEDPIKVVVGDKELIVECGGTPPPPPPPPPKDFRCKPCGDFPFTYTCKNDKIKEVQKCIGAKPDGCYGPETQAKLGQKGYSLEITKEVFDKITQNCGKDATDDEGGKLQQDVYTGTDV